MPNWVLLNLLHLQRVRILYIRTNSAIPSDILGRKRVNDWKQILAAEAERIASDNTLRSVLRTFLESGDNIDWPAYCTTEEFNPNCYEFGYPQCCWDPQRCTARVSSLIYISTMLLISDASILIVTFFLYTTTDSAMR